MRALVTGGAGFIGSNLVDRLLAEGHSVDVVDDLSTGSLANLGDARRDPAHDFTFHRLDVRSDALLDVLPRRRPEVVFHLAGSEDAARPVVDADLNVLGSVNVLEAARAAGARKVVFASSVGALEPATAHDVAKRAVGEYLAVYRAQFDMEFTVLVLGSVYGPRQAAAGPAGVVVSFAERLLRGESCTVHGSGADAADYVYVDDAVDAFARAAERGGGLSLQIGTGVLTTVEELHDTMAGALGLDLALAEADAGADADGPVVGPALDPARAAIHLGWKPWTTVPEGTLALLRHLAG
ncbi:MAG TPA: NAD-dependent epimerase/dehydratase family protein [Acidimicrobiales bacterium]|nr:NAD-dependent epimerase/dehydratase family protein [Acidimicrobiales bacterium]